MIINLWLFDPSAIIIVLLTDEVCGKITEPINVLFEPDIKFEPANVPINVLNLDNKYIKFDYTSDSVGLTGQTEYTFTVSGFDLNATVLIVGGGGGGGYMGGGGGGGDVFEKYMTIPIGTHKIRVGRGGLGASSKSNELSYAGFNSSLILQSGTEYTYCGGGGGASWGRGVAEALRNGYSSGGGGGGALGGQSGKQPSNGGTGNVFSGNGGKGGGWPIGTGGGGGASASGGDGSLDPTNGNGNGGKGVTSDITGSNIGYGGGGGGGARGNGQPHTCKAGSGVDGGGNGGYAKSPGSVNGTNGTGGGGGGGGEWRNDNAGTGGTGGSGVIIIKYS